MSYTTFLLDLDHTLLDSDTSEAMALEQTLVAAGIAEPAEHVADYRRINLALWKAVERGELLPQQVKTRRFEQLAEENNLNVDASRMAEDFVTGLGSCGDLYAGAREVLETLSKRASLAMVTNGLSEVQRARIARLELEQYFDAITISAEVDTAKPGTKIFDLTFAALGNPPKHQAVMVGDSLSSDIEGGRNFSIDTCWYNPKRQAKEPGVEVTHEIQELRALLGLVG